MNREQLHMARKVEAAWVLGCEEIILLPAAPPPSLCCCPNHGQPDKDGLTIQNAGCKVHGRRSTRPGDR